MRGDTEDFRELFINDVPMMDARAPVEFEKGEPSSTSSSGSTSRGMRGTHSISRRRIPRRDSPSSEAVRGLRTKLKAVRARPTVVRIRPVWLIFAR